ncbi:MAG: methylated-DNA--[protein]-cysteine S-methyltransferase [Actinomycetota bacterium]|nr:methylated-DNA--[protein]-cysteine S-methyltransferase [Actinomycetota bacterium]
MAVTSVRYGADGWGVGELWLGGDRVLYHELPRPPGSAPPAESAPIPVGGGVEPPEFSVTARGARDRDEFATTLVRRLERFFAGDPVDFRDVRLALDGLSVFHRALAETLRRVPRGDVVTYGELAALAGRPGAARAAGTFCAQNRFAVFVPCHRVVSAGGVGGYGSLGVEYKRRLLALEDVAL